MSSEIRESASDESSQEEYIIESCLKRNRRVAKKARRCIWDNPLGASGHYEVFSSISISPDQALLSDTKEALLALSMSQKDLADELGVSQTKISQYLNGGSRMRGWKSMEDSLLVWVNSKQPCGDKIESFSSCSEELPSPRSDTPSCQSDSEEPVFHLEQIAFEREEVPYEGLLSNNFDYSSYEDSWCSFSIMAVYGDGQN